MTNKRALRCFLCLVSVLLCFSAAAFSEAPDYAEGPEEWSEPPEVFPPAEYSFSKSRIAHYESDTLIWSIESFTLDSVQCYLTKIWLRDPARQIRKVNAPWKEALKAPLELAKSLPGTMLAANASGYISAAYPDIPESYPGVPEDYYFTTLGSLVVTDGEVLRNLEGVPFYGLALTEDGISLFRGADNEEVLAASPRQTWAFFEPCAMQVGGVDTLPPKEEWPFADVKHLRTVIARVNRNNYLMMHVRYNSNTHGLTLYRVNRFFSRHFQTEWVYNLDGGSSSALIYRKKDTRLTLLAKNSQLVADIICFTE